MSRAPFAAVLALLCLLGTARADEDELMGFIVDYTISHIGHDFYRAFSERLRDTSKLDFNLVVRERPDARWGSLIWVEYEQRVLYRRFLPPNTSELQPAAYEAADLVLEAIAQQKLQRLLQDTHDMERDEL
ncbi:curli assembly protein CsgE [compost metagenome]